MNTEPHTDSVPSQGIFIGNLALALIVFAILVPIVALIAAAMQGFS